MQSKCAPADLCEMVEEGAPRAGGELGEVGAQRDVAGLQPGPVRRVRRVQPPPVAEDPSPFRPAMAAAANRVEIADRFSGL
jgi:hypothetical protein